MAYAKPPKDEKEARMRVRQQEILDTLPPPVELRVMYSGDIDCVDPDVAAWKMVEKEEKRGKRFTDGELIREFCIAMDEVNTPHWGRGR